MALLELVFSLIGVCVVLCWLARALTVLSPQVCYPLPENFFTSMGKWAVITGGSDGIGKAYAQELGRRGLNVVIISRSKEKLNRTAREIELKNLRKVIVIPADFTKDDIYGHIKKIIKDLDIAVLVNNVGILPSYIPCKLLETVHLEEKINQMINCNVKTMVKMCHIILPGMVKRERGIILNISSGMAKVPFPLYTLYSATKVFVERFSLGLQAEYKSSGVLIQNVSPFGVSTSMTGYQKPNLITFSPEEFVKSSLVYLKTGAQTYGSISHTILGWAVQTIPTWVLGSEAFQHSFQQYVKKRVEM
ncbi:17-beta-hydroxysteroid dehydrogenase type 3 [Trichomycterus rosablanca]|uniref:17-beta-hydroxysteroid dehydrogenase type 3 n=1 Tax=Trichomycterus rosablanca TaxID=2290929 RepID=UPI002F359CA0